MTSIGSSELQSVVRRNIVEVQGAGKFEVFDELFADDFLDHTPQPGRTPDKRARDSSTKASGALSPIFTPRSIGKCRWRPRDHV